jgi:hypothetical protein
MSHDVTITARERFHHVMESMHHVINIGLLLLPRVDERQLYGSVLGLGHIFCQILFGFVTNKHRVQNKSVCAPS